MTFKKIIVIESEKETVEHIKNRNLLKNLLDILRQDYEWIKFPELNSDSFKEKDLVITLGGDGVFIRSSHFARNIPILPINSDPNSSEGALTEFQGVDKVKIEEILVGNYKIQERTRGRVLRNGTLIKELVVNEVYIGVENQFHTSRYKIQFKDNIEEQRSSGIIICTGTGSTAWYKSAGGKPFPNDENKLKFIVREIYEANLFKPKIKEGELKGEDEIILTSERKEGGIIAIDGIITYPFNLGDKVEIRICKQNLKVIAPKG